MSELSPMGSQNGLFGQYLENGKRCDLETPSHKCDHFAFLRWLMGSVSRSNGFGSPQNSHFRLFPTIRSLLKDSNVDVRIEAGELIAHLFELGRDYDEDFDSQVIRYLNIVH